MGASLLAAQVLNGLQLGILLFLMSAGLTLVLGIMNCINLMHGSLYMIGAYLAAAGYVATGSFVWAGVIAVSGTFVVGVIVERLVLSHLYERDHLDQVLATVGLIFFFNEMARMIWGPAALAMDVPGWLSEPITIFGLPYPSYRFAFIAVGLIVAGALYLLIHKTRMGIVIRAGASNAEMTAALGINVTRLRMFVVGLGAALAGLAGLMASPLVAVQSGMGEPILVLTLIIIVIGGVGSVRGAFYGALIIGLFDTIGRTLFPTLMRELMERSQAQATSAVVTSLLVYILMAVVLAVRPQGLFPVKAS
ncbi:branched-chain amino acid ABC transporter permease [Pseudorhodoplanes sp.]|uniref:branched-chain amino acid ABC transporter permease n=1 Tax=Pseudorhodoplanes sp. TaxID=1934341 RepID=UPI003D0EAD80